MWTMNVNICEAFFHPEKQSVSNTIGDSCISVHDGIPLLPTSGFHCVHIRARHSLSIHWCLTHIEFVDFFLHILTLHNLYHVFSNTCIFSQIFLVRVICFIASGCSIYFHCSPIFHCRAIVNLFIHSLFEWHLKFLQVSSLFLFLSLLRMFFLRDFISFVTFTYISKF